MMCKRCTYVENGAPCGADVVGEHAFCGEHLREGWLLERLLRWRDMTDEERGEARARRMRLWDEAHARAQEEGDE